MYDSLKATLLHLGNEGFLFSWAFISDEKDNDYV